MVSFFREKSPTGFFLIVLLSITLHARLLFEPPAVVVHPTNGFIHVLFEPLASLHFLLLVAIYHLLVLVTAFRLNHVLDDLKMFPKQTLIPAMCYVLFSALYVSWSNLIPALLINLLLVWIFFILAKTYHAQKTRGAVFNAGLITGSVVMLYYPAVAIVAIAIMSLAIIRPFKLQEWFIMALGILTPFYFLGITLFLQDEFANFNQYLPHLEWQIIQKTSSQAMLVNLLWMLILLIMGVFYWQANTGRILMQARKYWNVLLVMLLFLIPMPMLLEKSGIESAMVLIVPLSALVSNVFVQPRQSLVPGFVFWIFIIIVVLNHWVLRS